MPSIISHSQMSLGCESLNIAKHNTSTTQLTTYTRIRCNSPTHAASVPPTALLRSPLVRPRFPAPCWRQSQSRSRTYCREAGPNNGCTWRPTDGPRRTRRRTGDGDAGRLGRWSGWSWCDASDPKTLKIVDSTLFKTIL